MVHDDLWIIKEKVFWSIPRSYQHSLGLHLTPEMTCWMRAFSFMELPFVIRLNTSVTFRRPKQVYRPNLHDFATPIPKNNISPSARLKKKRRKVGWVSRALKSRTFCFRTLSVAAFSFRSRTEMSILILQIAKTIFIKRSLLTLPLQRVILVRIKEKWEFTDQVTTKPNYWMTKWTGQVKIIYNFNKETVGLRFSKHFSVTTWS